MTKRYWTRSFFGALVGAIVSLTGCAAGAEHSVDDVESDELIASSFLSDLTPTSATNGWGPYERDQSNGEQAAGDGQTITIAGTSYTKGLGVHASSDLSYTVPDNCQRFRSVIGIDDEVGDKGSVRFIVLLNGNRVYRSAVLTGSSSAVSIDVAVSGGSRLTLRVNNGGNGSGYDHADWANARFVCETSEPVLDAGSIVTDAGTAIVDAGSPVVDAGSATLDAGSIVDAGSSTPDAGSTSSFVLPTPNAGFDYQLGGAYTPPSGVQIVSRDRTERPAAGIYNICYVNGFQVQPDEESWWLSQHPDLILRDSAGNPVVDADWDEMLLDTSTAAKRTALAAIVGGWIAECASDGFDAIEIDNLDSYSRSGGRLTQNGAVAFMRLLSDIAHANGVAISQKNSAELVSRRAEMATDFAVVEECNRYSECGDFTSEYGDHVFIIEYRSSDFSTGCSRYPNLSIVLRDVNLVTPGSGGYVRQGC